jgi:hypothetical protein
VLGIQPGIARQHAVRDARTLRALVDARCAPDPEPTRSNPDEDQD